MPAASAVDSPVRTSTPALSMRAAVAAVREERPDEFHESCGALPSTEIGLDYARRYAGVPASSRARPEHVVVYRTAGEHTVRNPLAPVVLGLYGDEDRVRGWLPGYPDRASPATVAAMLGRAREPVRRARRARSVDVDLSRLPAFQVTAADAGRYLSMGLVHARGASGEALSVHRMLVLDERRLTLWMVPGRTLAALHTAALRDGRRLPVSISIGAPPAAMVASAVNGRFLPRGVSKLALAGALAGRPLAVSPAETQPAQVLAEAEIVLEGHLDGTTSDESVTGPPGGSMPEFLGYPGQARRDLPVITVTGMSVRPGAMYQAVVGPGREQSVILGLGGAISVASSGFPHQDLVRDLHFSPAGGGMLMLAVSLRKTSVDADRAPAEIAASVFGAHPFVKVIFFVDDDVDVRSAEDVLWAVSTRANLGVDCVMLRGYPAIPMDPSQTDRWLAERGAGRAGRTFVDATVPFQVQDIATRSFEDPYWPH